MRCNGNSGGLTGSRGGSQNSLLENRHAIRDGCRLDDTCFDACIGNSLLDFLDKELGELAVVRFLNSGGKRRWPVHTTICIPDFRETSSAKRTSRPPSAGLRSTTVLMPASRAALSLSTASVMEMALLLNVFLEPGAS